MRKYKHLSERFGFDDIDQPFDENDKKNWKDDAKDDFLFSKTNSDDSHVYFGDEDEENMYEEEEEYEENEEEDDDDDDDDGDENDNKYDLSSEDAEAFEHLASTIRAMIGNIGLDNFYVNVNGPDISIQFILDHKERFSKIMKIMGLINKLSTDILIQYDSEVELWETRDGDPLLTFDFFWETNPKKKNMFNIDTYTEETWSNSGSPSTRFDPW